MIILYNYVYVKYMYILYVYVLLMFTYWPSQCIWLWHVEIEICPELSSQQLYPGVRHTWNTSDTGIYRMKQHSEETTVVKYGSTLRYSYMNIHMHGALQKEKSEGKEQRKTESMYKHTYQQPPHTYILHTMHTYMYMYMLRTYMYIHIYTWYM